MINSSYLWERLDNKLKSRIQKNNFNHNLEEEPVINMNSSAELSESDRNITAKVIVE